MYISTHQSGIFPGTGPIDLTGVDAGEGYTVNLPFRSNTGDVTFEMAYQQIIEPILQNYKPSIILVSIGTDAHYRDPLAGLALSSGGYLSLANNLQKAAKKLCDGKISFFLEGGYDVDVLAEIVTAILATFGNHDYELEFNDKIDKDGVGEDVVESALEVQREHWDL